MNEQSNLQKPETKKVGYRNPPEKSRFKKGQSGNRRGRPPGRLNLATVLEQTLREKVVINENGKRRTVTKLQAAIKEVVNQAASGQLKAVTLLATLMRFYEEHRIQSAALEELSAGETNINLFSVNIDEATGRRLAETYLGRHGGLLETRNSE